MPDQTHDFAHLAALIEAAAREAERLGAVAAPVTAALGEATRAARLLAAGGPDEGVRPGGLTTENDR